MVRRVVTGHDAGGRSVVVSDEQVDGFDIGDGAASAFTLWGRDDAAHYPDDGSEPEYSAMFPPIGGCRLAGFTIEPGGTPAFDDFIATGLAGFADPARPGMHRTASLDFDIVVTGRVGLELDDGLVELGPGDIVVQNGTRHRWLNVGDTRATLVAITIGAAHDHTGH